MAKEKIIVVIDIQSEYGEWFSYNYLNKVARYLEKEKAKGIQILTMIEPFHDFLERQIDIAAVPKFLVDVSNDIGYKFFQDELLEPVLHSNKQDVFLYNDRVYPVYMSRILQKLCDFSTKDVVFELVGGGYSKCVNIVHCLLEQRGFEVIRNKDMCYDIRIVNTNRHLNIFNEKPPSYIPKKLCRSDGNFKCVSVDTDKDFIHLVEDLMDNLKPVKRLTVV